jgi:hypothetical protein
MATGVLVCWCVKAFDFDRGKSAALVVGSHQQGGRHKVP